MFLDFPVRFERSTTPSPSTAYYGYVELIAKDGNAYTICSEEWGDKHAKVACKDMGFLTGRAFNNLLLEGFNATGAVVICFCHSSFPMGAVWSSGSLLYCQPLVLF